MNFIDRSPAGFIGAAFVVVYAVIAVEIGMWMISTALAVAATFGVVVAGAVWVFRVAMHMLDDEEGTDETVPAQADPTRAGTPAATAHRAAHAG